VSFFILGIWQYLNRRKIASITAKETYTVTTQSGQQVSLNLQDILFIGSDDNYVDIHFETSGNRNKIMLRSSLKNVESQIVNPLSPIIRCHRSYLINSEHFEIVNSSSRSMTIGLKNYDHQIPVSRQYIPSIKTRLTIRP
jgi:DNA-binding LytR/AlgR family response regulator